MCVCGGRDLQEPLEHRIIISIYRGRVVSFSKTLVPDQETTGHDDLKHRPLHPTSAQHPTDT
jgi:hypothetical protein